jgi:hypothetical protein
LELDIGNIGKNFTFAKATVDKSVDNSVDRPEDRDA